MVKLDHIGICASNTKILKDWYVKLFEMDIVYDNKKEMPTYFLQYDGGMIEIYAAESSVEPVSNKHQGIRHLSFLTEDLVAAHSRLVEANVEIIEPLKEHANGSKTVFFRDPEGNIIHYIQRP